MAEEKRAVKPGFGSSSFSSSVDADLVYIGLNSEKELVGLAKCDILNLLFKELKNIEILAFYKKHNY